MKKTLWFEGAGAHDEQRWNDVKNCRLRTAFHNIEGKAIYLELLGCTPNKEWKKRKYKDTPFGERAKLDWYTAIDCAFEITDDPDVDDENYSRFNCERNQNIVIPWTLNDILNFINSYFGCNYDEIRISDELEAYAVHADGKRNTPAAYRFGDEFVPIQSNTEKANIIKKHFYDLEERHLNEERKRRICWGNSCPNFSIWRDHDNLDVLYIKNNHFKGITYPSPINLGSKSSVRQALEFTF